VISDLYQINSVKKNFGIPSYPSKRLNRKKWLRRHLHIPETMPLIRKKIKILGLV